MIDHDTRWQAPDAAGSADELAREVKEFGHYAALAASSVKGTRHHALQLGYAQFGTRMIGHRVNGLLAFAEAGKPTEPLNIAGSVITPAPITGGPMTTEGTTAPPGYQAAVEQLRAERDAAIRQRDAYERERDHFRSERNRLAIERDLLCQERDAAHAHCVSNDEHQRAVNECAALGDKLKAQSDGLNKHWSEQVRTAKAEGRRRASSLSAMLHAHVNAIAGEDP